MKSIRQYLTRRKEAKEMMGKEEVKKMQGKVLDFTRRKLLKEYEDKLFRLAVYDAAKKEGLIVETEDEEKDNPDFD